MKPLEWHPRARQDVADSAFWYAQQGGLPLGKRFVDAVQGVLEGVVAFPAAGSLRHAGILPGTAAPVRYRVVSGFDRYLIYYFELPATIKVLRVWDASRGLADLLDQPID